MDLLQAALWSPQGPGERAPKPPSVQPGPRATGSTHDGTPAHGPLPERALVPPWYEVLLPEYASPAPCATVPCATPQLVMGMVFAVLATVC